MQAEQASGAPAAPAADGQPGSAAGGKAAVHGGRFDFDDGGTYCGGWEDGKAHGHGVCTGPKGQGAYSGSWHYGFEVSGVYTWPSGSNFEGQWQNGKRHGLGVETRGRWLYRGEWTQGFKGRYGVRQSATSHARYEGTWANGLQDGYGSETYADGGTYQGQWLRGMRHGYGVRASAPFGLASHTRPDKAVRASTASLRSQDGAGGDPTAERDRRVGDARGGFVLKARSDEPPARRRSLVEKTGLKKSILSGLKIRRSTGDLDKRGHPDSLRSTGSSASWVSTESSHSGVTSASVHTDSNASFVVQDEQLDASVTETYMGEWKNDKRSGFGISERSDGLRYEGEWFANKKYGYGVTTLRDGAREEGKYKNNVLVTSQKKKHLFLIRSAKFRERIDAAVSAAQRASKIALQKADIAISRTATARGKAELADMAEEHAREDSDTARDTARQFAPDFQQPGLEKIRARPKYAPLPALDGQLPLRAPPALAGDQEAPRPYMNKVGPAEGGRLPNALPPQPQYQPQPPPQQQYQQQQQQQQQYQQQLQQQQYQQQQQQQQQFQPAPQPPPPAEAPAEEGDGHAHAHAPAHAPAPARASSLRRNSRVKATESPAAGYQQSMNDRFDQYKRPPSRDSSVDRYARATARLMGSRQASVDKSAPPAAAPGAPGAPGALGREASAERGLRAPSAARGLTPAPGAGAAGNGAAVGAGAGAGQPPPFEEVLLRKRNLGQDIIPSPGQPKRTESLYIAQAARAPKAAPAPTPLQRKKSLPDVQALPGAAEAMSREEVSLLSSARREEVRRLQEETERLRANPLLYLVSPHVREWFSRQQLVLVVLFINISLAIMFFKLLT